MVKLRNCFFRKQNSTQCDEILSTFMKITRVINSGAPDIHFCQFCILLVWSANGNAPFQGKFQVNLLNDDTYRWNCAISSYGQRVRCALNMEILDLLNEESISGARLVYKFDEKSYCECLKR